MKALLTIVISVLMILISSAAAAEEPEEVCFDVVCNEEVTICKLVEVECFVVVYVEDPLVRAEYEFQRALSEWNSYWEIGEGRR